MNPFVRWYAKFVTKHPLLVSILCVLLVAVSLHFAQNIGTKNLDSADMLPDGIEVIDAFNYVSDEFGGSSGANVILEVQPSNGTTIKDLRNPEVLRYSYQLAQEIQYIESVSNVQSLGTVLKEVNEDHFPGTILEVKELLVANPQAAQYITSDYTMQKIRISLEDGYDTNLFVSQLQKVLDTSKKPYGVTAKVSGDDVAQEIVMNNLSDDMNKTSMISMIGIIVILFVIFRSIFYGLSPLLTIIFGLIWAFGYIGLAGIQMSSASSGVVSMIMGIGIDFGIQTISRFKQEMKKTKKPAKAMQTTIENVFMPMLTTTIAGAIGFMTMTLGELSILSDMGIMMTYGLIACFLAAVTIVPSIIVVKESMKTKKVKK